MNEKNKDLISFSDAARIRGVKPQTIDGYVKRGRLKVIEISEKKFLDKKDVENLQKKKSGRPAKSTENSFEKTLEKIRLTIEKIDLPEKHHPQIYKELFQFRKKLSNPDFIKDVGIHNLWWNPVWRKNKKILRRSLKQYPMIWGVGDWMGGLIKDCVVRKYKDPLIQNFYEFSLMSNRMYENFFFITLLKHDFVSFVNAQLGVKTTEEDKQKLEKQLIVAMFEECLDKNCSGEECKGRKPNPMISGYKVISIIKKDKTILLSSSELKKIQRIKRILYDNTVDFRTKSTSKLKLEWGKIQREIKKK